MKRLFLLLFFLFSSNLWAGFYFNPSFGLKIAGDAELGGNEYSVQETDVGFKLGYKYSYFFGGLSLELLYPTYEQKSASETKESYSGFQWGLFFGGRYDWYRGWFSLILNSTQSSDIDQSKIKGGGWELGFGFGPENFINAFLKYQKLSFDQRENSQGVSIELLGGQEIKSNVFIIGIDFPIHMGGGGPGAN